MGSPALEAARQHICGQGIVDPDVVESLLYYCEAWHLAWTGESMFPDCVVVALPEGPRVRPKDSM